MFDNVDCFLSELLKFLLKVYRQAICPWYNYNTSFLNPYIKINLNNISLNAVELEGGQRINHFRLYHRGEVGVYIKTQLIWGEGRSLGILLKFVCVGGLCFIYMK